MKEKQKNIKQPETKNYSRGINKAKKFFKKPEAFTDLWCDELRQRWKLQITLRMKQDKTASDILKLHQGSSDVFV